MKLSPERKAIIGIVVVLAIFTTGIIYIGNRNLWFEAKHTFFTEVEDAEGLSPGSVVTLSGIRVGEVESLRVNEINKVEVMFTVRKSLAHKIRKDSLAKLVRTFMIGEKRIELLPGSRNTEVLENFGSIKSAESTELTDLLSGKKISSLILRLDRFMDSVDSILIKFDKLSADDIENATKALAPTLDNVNGVMRSLRYDLAENGLLKKTLYSVERIATPVAKRQVMINSMLNNLDTLSQEIEGNKNFAREINEALRELIITLKALQKTWLLEDYSNQVRDEKKK